MCRTINVHYVTETCQTKQTQLHFFKKTTFLHHVEPCHNTTAGDSTGGNNTATQTQHKHRASGCSAHSCARVWASSGGFTDGSCDVRALRVHPAYFLLRVFLDSAPHLQRLLRCSHTHNLLTVRRHRFLKACHNCLCVCGNGPNKPFVLSSR